MALAGIHNSGSSSPNFEEQSSSSDLIEIESFNSRLADNLIEMPEKSESEVNKIIFNSQIQQIQCDRLDEDVASALNCNGADGDISWIGLIVCIVILILAVPLIYVFYILEHPEQYHHHVS
ncbi:hypothetical protein NQ318_006229 [Aromia moschata]|uniref:Uncharacterized protein n=1 Tax=Aromia moschata TaxID=1265417 RepID=A0AAV8XUN9_9CUCU|nr:hypothetical protein NQ318_006229 [Aromia moschata]